MWLFSFIVPIFHVVIKIFLKIIKNNGSFVHFFRLLPYAINNVSMLRCVASICDMSGIRSSSRMICTCPRLISMFQCFRTSDSFLKLPIKLPFASQAEYLKPFMPLLTFIIVACLFICLPPFFCFFRIRRGAACNLFLFGDAQAPTMQGRLITAFLVSSRSLVLLPNDNREIIYSISITATITE